MGTVSDAAEAGALGVRVGDNGGRRTLAFRRIVEFNCNDATKFYYLSIVIMSSAATATEEVVYPRKADFRQRAHCNPLSFNDLFDHPTEPTEFDTASHYPAFFPAGSSSDSDGPFVEIADVGCGFGGLLVGLAPLYPETLIMGMEIRAKVTEFVRRRILALRAGKSAPEHGTVQALADEREQERRGDALELAAAAVAAAKTTSAGAFQNISVLRTNAMKFLPCYFRQGQLSKLFFCFPDPHFKAKNHRRRIVSAPLLDEYAYALRPGGRLYTITDVKPLHDWMAEHSDAHRCFARIGEDQLALDPAVAVMTKQTEEGKKVSRNEGAKYIAVYERLADDVVAANAAAEPFFG